eukprot:4409054-Amphidinium_carterae.1
MHAVLCTVYAILKCRVSGMRFQCCYVANVLANCVIVAVTTQRVGRCLRKETLLGLGFTYKPKIGRTSNFLTNSQMDVPEVT